MPNQTPNLFAAGNIAPYRMVYVPNNGSAFTVLATPTAPEYSSSQVQVIGVTDGSTEAFTNSYHASAGRVVTLQRTEVVLLTAANSIPAGGYVEPTTGGLALYNPPPWPSFDRFRYKYFQALQSANANEVFWALQIGSCVMHGSV